MSQKKIVAVIISFIVVDSSIVLFWGEEGNTNEMSARAKVSKMRKAG